MVVDPAPHPETMFQSVDDRLLEMNRRYDEIFTHASALAAGPMNSEDKAVAGPADESYGKAMKALSQIDHQAAALQPNTLFGFGLKARLLSRNCHCWWDASAEGDDIEGRTLVDQLLAATGLAPYPCWERGESEEFALEKMLKAHVGAPVVPVAPDVELLAAGKVLDEVQARRDTWTPLNEGDEDPHFDAHWDARQRIGDLRATTLAGLKVKARAAELALRYDADADCRMRGAFIDISVSLLQDIKAMSTLSAPVPAPEVPPNCPVERLARRYGPLTKRWDQLVQSEDPLDRGLRSDGVVHALDSIAQMAEYEQAISAVGAMFQIQCLAMLFENNCVAKAESVETQSARRLLSSAIRYLETVSGVSSDEIGRDYTGPVCAELGPCAAP